MQSYYVALLSLIFCCLGLEITIAHSQNSSISEASLKHPENLTVEQKWEKIEENAKNMIERGIKMVLPLMYDNSGVMNISSTCMSDGMRLFAAARKMRPWALKIIGANSNMITAVAFETLTSMGAYDQCVETQFLQDRGNKKGEIIMRGKYCTLEAFLPLPPQPKIPVPLDEPPPELKNFSRRDTPLGHAAKYAGAMHAIGYRIGVCVPSGCSESDVTQMAGRASESSYIRVQTNFCETKRSNEYTPLIIGLLIMYVSIALLVATATLAHYFTVGVYQNDGMHMKLLLSFSFQTNWKQLFNFNSPNKELLCLDGIRTFSMLWIVLGHTYSNFRFDAIRGMAEFIESLYSPFLPVVYRGFLAVDSFFVLGGLLSCYGCMKIAGSLKTTSRVCSLILQRYLRLLPAVAFVMTSSFIMNLLGSGPFFHEYEDLIGTGCRNSWWRTMLFITNLFASDRVSCMGHTWYLACDLQLYSFTLLLIVPLMRKKWWGVPLSVGCILAGMASTTLATLLNDLPPEITLGSTDFDIEKGLKFMSYIHVMPYVHLGPYVVGVLTGYLLFIKPKLRMSKLVVILGWSVFFVWSALVYIGMYRWNLGLRPTLLETVIYSACIRTAWAVAVSWLVIACAYGYGGFINTLLSLKIWIPARRLSYSVYLTHMPIMVLFYGVLRTEKSLLHATYIWEFFGHTVASYAFSILVFLCIESPFWNLQKLVFGRKSKPPPVKENNGCITEEMEKGPPEGDLTPLPQKESLKPGGLDNPVFVQKL